MCASVCEHVRIVYEFGSRKLNICTHLFVPALGQLCNQTGHHDIIV